MVIYNYCIGREGQTISPVVWNKNFWMEIESLFKMIDQRENIYKGCTKQGIDYIDIRIKKRVLTCYNAYFIQFHDNSNDNLMKKLDDRVRKFNTQLYNDIGNISLFNVYYYVKFWRNHNIIFRSFLAIGSKIKNHL